MPRMICIRSSFLPQNPKITAHYCDCFLSLLSSPSHPQNSRYPDEEEDSPLKKTKILLSPSYPLFSSPKTLKAPVGSHSRRFSDWCTNQKVLASVYVDYGKNCNGCCSNLRISTTDGPSGGGCRLYGSQSLPAVNAQPSTSDGLTADKIIDNQWPVLAENDADWKSNAAAVAQSIHVMKKRLKWNTLLVRIEQLSTELDKPNIWDDSVYAGKISREHASLLGKMKQVNAIERELIEHIDMLKLAWEESDSELEKELLEGLLTMRRKSKEKELDALFTEQDSCSCYIEVQAGAGGTESMDWASMVLQMYKMWGQRRGYNVTIVDEMAGDVAGIKRATIKVDGEYAFGYAKAEVGVHRLVRISPFDSAKRRHTSFAAVAVIPILEDSSSRVQINESDLHIERFRSGGPGGQHANTTDSAVRIIHMPTGLTATCQNERSQHMNKASAMAVLQSRLVQLEKTRQAQMNAQHTQSLTDISWGNQIRSYVLHPYRMVKDTRTNYEVSSPESVLDGDLDGFILSYLSLIADEEHP